MALTEEVLIRVYGSWNGWEHAEVRLANIRGVHWLQPDHAPHRLLYARVSCTDFVSGNIPHQCDESAPHDLLVCVLKRHVLPSAYAELVRCVELSSVPSLVDRTPRLPGGPAGSFAGNAAQ